MIFDLWGTLVDTFRVDEYERATAEMAAIVGVPHEAFAQLWRETWYERVTGAFGTIEAEVGHVCEALGIDAEAERVADAALARFDATRRSLAPRRDAVETLRRLRLAGFRIGLISDCSAEVPALWPSTPFADLIDVPIFSCSVGLKKPDPRIYHLVCQELSVSPRQCIYVGDGSSWELTGARQVGMQAVLLSVPLDDAYDAQRGDVEEWTGPTISALMEVLAIVS